MNSKYWVIVVFVFLAASIAVDFYAIYLRHEQLRMEEAHIQKVHEENMLIINSIAKQLKMIEEATKNERTN